MQREQLWKMSYSESLETGGPQDEGGRRQSQRENSFGLNEISRRGLDSYCEYILQLPGTPPYRGQQGPYNSRKCPPQSVQITVLVTCLHMLKGNPFSNYLSKVAKVKSVLLGAAVPCWHTWVTLYTVILRLLCSGAHAWLFGHSGSSTYKHMNQNRWAQAEWTYCLKAPGCC